MTTLPLLLLVFLSLSLAWAGAFSGTSSLVIGPRRHHQPVLMPPSTSPRVPLSLSTLLLLRGGQQQQQAEEQDTVISDETASLGADTDISSNMQRRYGTNDESGGSVEMTESQQHDAAPVDVESGANGSKTSVPSLLSVMAPVSSLLKAAADFYSQQLTLRPILTKSVTAGIIFGMSDWCAQLIERSEDSNEPIVFSRILTAFLVGILFFGPAANLWYSMIFKLLPSTSLLSTLQKAALGQLIFGPTFTCVFFGAGMIQSGSFSMGGWLQKIQSDLPAVWASGLGFWPLVDFVSYKLIPVHWIPLFVNFCSFVWTIYLSLVANRSKSVES